MSLSRSEVASVSLLARLQLSEAELDRLTSELVRIVEYVELLGEVPTDDVQPMAHAVEVHNVFAADTVQPSLPRESALANAPRANERAFLVPPVLGD